MNKYSEERKQQQALGNVPEWMTTQGYQMFVTKYLHQPTIKEQYQVMAKTAAKHVAGKKYFEDAEEWFFKLLWNGWLSPSTPVLANLGSGRGLPVSCSGGYVEDSIDGFYTARREAAILTKYGHGTSAYLGGIRGRGETISSGGVASGVLPVFKGFVQDMREVSQGSTRRGAWAGYIEITHKDFDEVCDYLHQHPDDFNVGWIIKDDFVTLLNKGNPEALRRFQKSLKVKMITGKGYYFKVDEANRHRPTVYVELGLDIKASNLCTEIMLHSSEEYTFTCVISSMNLAKYDDWDNTDAIYWATVFLDCVVSEYIELASNIPGLEKAVEFTKKGRAIGLGVCGWHTLLQQRGIPFESLDAQWLNDEIFSEMDGITGVASSDMGIYLGVPEWGTYNRNTHRIAIAPTKSTALIMGGVSEGINPDVAIVFQQNTAAGEVERITPVFLQLMKDKGVYDKEHIREIEDAFGSCQGVDWLTDEEKAVFKTAFEIDMHVVNRLAAHRQQYIDQGQSLNHFFGANATEEYISSVYKEVLTNTNILSSYYAYSNPGVAGSKGECEVCQ